MCSRSEVSCVPIQAFVPFPAAIANQAGSCEPVLPSKRVVVLGERKSGKLAVLLNAARTLPVQRPAWLLTARARAVAGAVTLPRSATPRDAEYTRVRVRYLADSHDFLKFLAALHLLPDSDLPGALIVDEERDLLVPSSGAVTGPATRSEHALAAGLALLMDALDHIASRTGTQPYLVLGLPPKQDLPVFVVWRYIPCGVELVADVGAGTAALTAVSGPACVLQPSMRSLRFWYRPLEEVLECHCVSE